MFQKGNFENSQQLHNDNLKASQISKGDPLDKILFYVVFEHHNVFAPCTQPPYCGNNPSTLLVNFNLKSEIGLEIRCSEHLTAAFKKEMYCIESTKFFNQEQ